MQRHGNVEVERIVVADADDEEHHHQIEIVAQPDPWPLLSQFVRANEALDGDKGELAEGDEVSGTGIVSTDDAINDRTTCQSARTIVNRVCIELPRRPNSKIPPKIKILT